jgi:hypothetical protein
MSNTITLYLCEKQGLDEKIATLADKVIAARAAIKTQEDTRESRGIGGKVWNYLSDSKTLDEQETLLTQSKESIKKCQRLQETNLTSLVLALGRHHMLQNPLISQQLSDYERMHENRLNARKYIQQIKNAFDKTYQIIDTALYDIDSAKSAETMDAFSDNKAMSVLSTSANNRANSSIVKVNAAVLALENTLRDENVALKQIEFDNTIEWIDLAIDMSDLGTLDSIFSLLSLSALNDAEQNLFNLKMSMKPHFDRINGLLEKSADECQAHETAMLLFKNEQRKAVIPALAAHDILLADDYFEKLEDLYAS